jgi:hypothetical protein
MSLFGTLFSPKKTESVAFVEIGADSVGGAYARFETGKPPLVIYTKRIPFEWRPDESTTAPLARALSSLGEFLIREGAPSLQRATGSGSITRVLASVASPWQDAAVRVEKLESPKPFVFTHAVLKDALTRSSVEPSGKLLVDETVIATMLNGYETHAPFGKRVSRASIVILAAAVDAEVGQLVASSIRGMYHTHETRLTAFARVSYAGIHAVFPHEEEYLGIEVRAGVTSLMLVKRDCLVGIMTIPPTPDGWLVGLKGALDALAVDHPLPHTLFLIAPDADRDALKQQIEGAHFETLWLSEGPPRVIPLTSELLAPLVAVAPEASRELFLSLLILFYQRVYTQGDTFA